MLRIITTVHEFNTEILIKTRVMNFLRLKDTIAILIMKNSP